METIRWGLLGCGDVAEKKGGPALALASGSSLDAVCSRSLEKAREFARRHGASRSSSEAEALFAAPDLDAIYIATPTFAHASGAFGALSQGRPVLLEKPMALTVEDCAALIDAGGTLHIAYYRRFWPKWQRVRRVLTSGALGAVVRARSEVVASSPGGWRDDPRFAGWAGNLGDMGSHRLDLLCWLVGPPQTSPVASGVGEPTAGRIELAWTTETGAEVSVALSSQGRPTDRFEIWCERGKLVCDSFDGGSLTIASEEGERVERFENPTPTHLPLIEALVRRYRGADEPDLPDAVSGAWPTRLLSSAEAAR